MAIVTIDSDLLLTTPVGTRNNPANRDHAYLCGCKWAVPALVAAADIGSTFRICTIPANGRVLLGLSKIVYGAGGTSAALHMGHEAYKDSTGALVPANPTFFGSGLTIVTANRVFLDGLTSPADEFDVPVRIAVTLTASGANLPIGFAMNGVIVYAAAFVG